jgi:hypothetical protein
LRIGRATGGRTGRRAIVKARPQRRANRRIRGHRRIEREVASLPIAGNREGNRAVGLTQSRREAVEVCNSLVAQTGNHIARSQPGIVSRGARKHSLHDDLIGIVVIDNDPVLIKRIEIDDGLAQHLRL